jgi:hypothetical protein
MTARAATVWSLVVFAPGSNFVTNYLAVKILSSYGFWSLILMPSGLLLLNFYSGMPQFSLKLPQMWQSEVKTGIVVSAGIYLLMDEE